MQVVCETRLQHFSQNMISSGDSFIVGKPNQLLDAVVKEGGVRSIGKRTDINLVP